MGLSLWEAVSYRDNLSAPGDGDGGVVAVGESGGFLDFQVHLLDGGMGVQAELGQVLG